MSGSSFSFPFSSPFGSGFTFVPSPGGTPLSSLGATPAGDLAGHLDQLLDPTTLDYVRTDNGEWAQTADSRTIMLLMLELELGASPFDPGDGTIIKERLRSGDPITVDEVRADALRAGRILAAAGVLSDLTVTVRDASGNALFDESGRSLILMNWRDLASGSPIDIVFQPG